MSILATMFAVCVMLSTGLSFAGCSDDNEEEETSETSETNKSTKTAYAESPDPVDDGFRVSSLSDVATISDDVSNSHTIEIIPEGEDGMEPDIANVEWSWRWDEDWISGHTKENYVYGYGYASGEESYNVSDDDRKFLAVSDMPSGDVSVEESSSIDDYMDIEVETGDDGNGLTAELTAKSAFGCPIILTCSLYDFDDYAETPYEVEIKLDYDSVLGSLGTLEDWVEVKDWSELDKASETARNIRLADDISGSSLSLSHRTHLDLNSHMLSVSSTDISGRARIEKGSIKASGDALNVEGTDLVEIRDLDIASSGYGIYSDTSNAAIDVQDCSIEAFVGACIAGSSSSMTLSDCEITGDNVGVEATDGLMVIEGGKISGKEGIRAEGGEANIDSCSVTGSSSFGIYASGSSTSVSATSCAIKSSSSDKDNYAGVYSASSASITVSGGSIEGPVGAWAYTGNVTIKDSASVTSNVGDGLKAYQGTMDVTGATISSADSGAYCTSTGTVKLTTCSITGTTYATYQSGGTLTASGGTLTGPNGCYCSGGTTTLQSSCSVTATNSSSGSAAYAAGGTVNATSCTLQGYYGARCSSGTATLSSCAVKSCTYGAYASGGTINLTGCTITSSITYGAQSAGGTINVQSSTSISASSYGVYSTSGTVAISGSSSVTSTGSYGAYVNGGKVTVSDSSTTVSSSTSYGIYLYSSSSSSATVTSATVKSSSSSSYGAYVAAGTLTLSGATIEGGYGARVAGGTLTYSGSSAIKITGNNYYGLYVSSGSATLNNATIKGSSYGAYVSGGSCTISGGSVSGRTAVYSSASTTINSSCKIEGTSTSYSGVVVDGGTTKISGSSIKGSMLACLEIDNGTADTSGCEMLNKYASGMGVYCEGTWYSDTDTVYAYLALMNLCGYSEIYYGVIASSTDGENVLTDGIGIFDYGGTTMMVYGYILAGYAVADYEGETGIGGCYVYGYYAGGYTFDRYSYILFASCEIESDGYGALSENGEIDIDNCYVYGYSAGVCSSGSYAYIYCEDSSDIEGYTYGLYVTSGKADVYGGAVSGNYRVYAKSGTVNLYSSCSVSVSTSSSYKYAATWSDGGTINASSCTLSGYYGAYSTAGTTTASSSCIIKSCTCGAYATGGTINLNGATMTSSINYGVYASGGTINVYGSTAISSSYQALDTRSGGKIYVYGSASVISTGSYGAYVYGGYIKLYGSATIRSNSSYGVYVCNSSSEFEMTAGTIYVTSSHCVYLSSGTVNWSGGSFSPSSSSCLFYQTGGTLSVSGLTFNTNSRNYIYYLGGGTASFSSVSTTNSYTGGTSYGVYVVGSAATFTNCTISATSSSYNAYGVYVGSGSATISGGTIQGTSTSSVGVGAYGSVTVNSSASVTGTSSTSNGYGIWVGGSSQTASVSGGTVTGKNTGNTTTYAVGAYVTAGSLTISGGTIKGTSTYCEGTGVIVSGSSASATVSGGTVTGERGSSSTYIACGARTISGTITLTGGSASANYPLYVSGGTMNINSGTWSSSNTYTAYVSSGTLNLNGGVVRNDTSSSSTMSYAVYNTGGTVNGNGTELYHYNYGYAFYNKTGSFKLSTGRYHSFYGTAIYIADTSSSISYIGSSNTDKDDCYIYRNSTSSSYTDPIVTIAGGTVTIYGCYIRTYYGPALELTGSPSVDLGYAYSGGSNSDTDAYTPKIQAYASGQYPIYVNMSGGTLYIQEADIYGVDYGIYIYDGYVTALYAWITLSASSGDAYAFYVEKHAASYFGLSLSKVTVTASSMASNKTVYIIYSAQNSLESSISYNESNIKFTGSCSYTFKTH